MTSIKDKISTILVNQSLVKVKIDILGKCLNDTMSSALSCTKLNLDESVLYEICIFFEAVNDYLLEFVTADGHLRLDNLSNINNVKKIDRVNVNETCELSTNNVYGENMNRVHEEVHENRNTKNNKNEFKCDVSNERNGANKISEKTKENSVKNTAKLSRRLIGKSNELKNNGTTRICPQENKASECDNVCTILTKFKSDANEIRTKSDRQLGGTISKKKNDIINLENEKRMGFLNVNIEKTNVDEQILLESTIQVLDVESETNSNIPIKNKSRSSKNLEPIDLKGQIIEISDENTKSIPTFSTNVIIEGDKKVSNTGSSNVESLKFGIVNEERMIVNKINPKNVVNEERVIISKINSKNDSIDLEKFSLNVSVERKTTMLVRGVYKVVVKRIEDFNNFFVFVMNDETRQFYKSLNAMSEFYEAHQTRFESLIRVSELKEQQFIVVYCDCLWYRAQIVSVETNTIDNNCLIHLLLIDFGKIIVEKGVNKCRKLYGSFDFPIILQKVGVSVEYSFEKQSLFNCMVRENAGLYYVKCKRYVIDKFEVLIKPVNFSIVVNNILKKVAQDDEIVEFSNHLVHKDGARTGSISDDSKSDEFLEQFDPMKEDFYSSTNDYNINPDDACQAVIGHVSTESKRRCKFGTNCWKKKCYRLHVDEDSSAAQTDDGVRFVRETYENLIEFDLNEKVRIRVTSVISIGRFYASRVCYDNVDDPDEETMASLHKFMNKQENVLKLRKLNVLPNEGEFVIVFHREQYFRGRVVCSNSHSENECMIFFVDFGMIRPIALTDLRQMQENYNWLPHQAVELSVRHCFRFNVDELSSDQYDQCLLLFETLFIHNEFDVVICSSNGVDVKLVTEPNGNNLVEYFSMCVEQIINSNRLLSRSCQSELNQ